MKYGFRVLAIVFALCIATSLSACGGNSGTVSGAEIQGSNLVKGAEFHYTFDEGCKETFNLRFYVTDAYDPQIGSQGIYMLDMDSGIMYDDTFLDWDLMIRGDGWNLDTRDSTLMVLLTTYIDNMDSEFIWSDAAQFTHLSKSDLKKMSSTLDFTPLTEPVTVQDSTDDLGYMETEPGFSEESAEIVIDADFVYEQAKLLNIQLKRAYRYRQEFREGPVVDLLFFHSTEFDGISLVSFNAPGMYMLDLDSGNWYDSSFIEPNLKLVNGEPDYTDKVSDMALTFSAFTSTDGDDLGMTGSQYVELDAQELEDINQKLLIEQLTRKLPVYPYASIEEESRQLSDDEIAALAERPAGYVKSVISTVPDAIAYLDFRFPELRHGNILAPSSESKDFWLRSAPEILADRNNSAARSCITTCISYLMDDNYDVQALMAFWPDPVKMNSQNPQKAINCIKTATGYLFFDPVLRMQGDAMSRWGDLLPQMSCSSVAEYIENIRQNPTLAGVIKYIFQFTGGIRMDFSVDYTNGYTVTTASEGVEMVYFSVPPIDPAQNIKPENIEKYMIASMLGGVTLSADEAYALVGAAPEVVRDKVKTAADVLMYMLAAKIADSNGCKCTPVGGHTWHWNMSAKEVMEKKLGNCGSCANLANYLLDGDYEEVGFMDQAYYPGNGGSHVYTYVCHQGKYYILDFSWYIFTNYEITQDYPVTVLDSLQQWPEKAQQIYGPVCLVMAYDTPGMQYPVIFGEEYEAEFGGINYILPEGCEYTILHEAPDGYKYHHIPFDKSAYDWTVFW